MDNLCDEMYALWEGTLGFECMVDSFDDMLLSIIADYEVCGFK
jgi:hypothetical protein